MPNDPTTPSEALVEVTQADRDAAVAFLGYRDWSDATDYRLTAAQDYEVQRAVQAFAKHRLASRPPVQSGELAATAETMAELIAAVMERHPHNDVFTVGRKDLEAIWNILATLQAPAPVQAGLGELIEPLLLFHETGGHEGDGSDERCASIRAALSTEATAPAKRVIKCWDHEIRDANCPICMSEVPQGDGEAVAAAYAKAWDVARGTNADLCKSPAAAYRLILDALKKLADAALSPPITEQPQGGKA